MVPLEPEMALRTAKLTSSRQVYLPQEVLDEAGIDAGDGSRFVVRVRGGVIELVPEELAAKVLDEGLEEWRRASLDLLAQDWHNEEDQVWDEVDAEDPD
jgi:bifunctional DNA-binding transcriptional regulator/antitoxin component of YhaV-PrlF toxin-antitoxin module